MNFCQSDIPGASLNRRLPTYETYRPRFDTTREALCIACMHRQNMIYIYIYSLRVEINTVLVIAEVLAT
jgi:hypothetical protein